jgi:hypothetical protein
VDEPPRGGGVRVVRFPFLLLTGSVKAFNLGPYFLFLVIVCLLPSMLTSLAARLRAARRPAEAAPRS